jgi:hypothetical protein
VHGQRETAHAGSMSSTLRGAVWLRAGVPQPREHPGARQRQAGLLIVYKSAEK